MHRAAVFAVLAVALIVGVTVFIAAGGAISSSGGGWRETRWPFPMDQWGEGRAFRCDASHCGADIALYVRPKIGFCNCTEGVSDDSELDRLSDFDFMAGNTEPRGAGRVVQVAALKGRLRSFGARAGDAPALTVALNSKCDALVATAMVSGASAAAAEPAVTRFLGGTEIQGWIARVLGG